MSNPSVPDIYATDRQHEASVAASSRALLKRQLEAGMHWLPGDVAAERLRELERRG